MVPKTECKHKNANSQNLTKKKKKNKQNEQNCVFVFFSSPSLFLSS